MNNVKTAAALTYRLLRLNITHEKQPVFLSFFLTNRCNLRCKYCFISEGKVDKSILTAEYTRDEAFELVDEFYAMGTRMIFLLGGEPLIHKDIGEIVEYITNKGILLHVITNGVLLEQKLEEVKKAHAICVSLDGIAVVNSCLRGEGVYEKAMAGLAKAKEAGLHCRIHAVISRLNLHRMEEFAKAAREIGITLTVSPPNHLGETDLDILKISDEEYRHFWTEYKEMKKKGYPIGNTLHAIETVRTWPIGYHEIMKDDTPLPQNYRKPVRCVNGDIYCGLGAEGTLYHCIQLGCLNGPNIREVGVRKAWDIIVNTRPNCMSCASINTIENSMALRMDVESLISGLKFQFIRR
jgi:MoaA/NifB/PqqE/SkfB family radical SAM enzyme